MGAREIFADSSQESLKPSDDAEKAVARNACLPAVTHEAGSKPGQKARAARKDWKLTRPGRLVSPGELLRPRRLHEQPEHAAVVWFASAAASAAGWRASPPSTAHYRPDYAVPAWD